MTAEFYTVIIGAGAAGLHCAAQALAGGSVLVLDHAQKPGEKIRISGGGRCNFTNLHCGADNFLSQNPHFIKSALAGYSQWDFIDLVNRHGIAYHEKTLGQLFCDGSAQQIIQMLLKEMEGAELWLGGAVQQVARGASGFVLSLGARGTVQCQNLVIATGGKSIPKMGASGFGHQVAQQFDLPMVDTRPGLVPLTFSAADLGLITPLAGVSLPVAIQCGRARFEEALLFTHRGLSGPAILQISSYWQPGQAISIDLLPGMDIYETLRTERHQSGKRPLTNVLKLHLPKRLVDALAPVWGLRGNIADQSDTALGELAKRLHGWSLHPNGSEGYRTAEVTLGGVDTGALNSATMECKTIPGLYFIGEVVDVTGWLGGYNFQWAWSSATAAGRAIAAQA